MKKKLSFLMTLLMMVSFVGNIPFAVSAAPVPPDFSGYGWSVYHETGGFKGFIGVNSGSDIVPIGDPVGSGFWMTGADFVEDTLYAVSYADSGTAGTNLYTIDTSTGVYTLVGNTGQAFTGFCYDSITETAYGVSSDGAASSLYSVNLSTGAATLIGNINAQIIIGIAVDNSGNLLGVDIASDSLMQIDKNTGTATLVGSLGIDVNYAQDIAYDRDNGVLYGTLYTSKGSLYRIETDTGVATWVRDLGTEVDGFAIPYNVTLAAAEIDGTSYATLDEALSAVTTGQTIKLLDDITYHDRIWVGFGYRPSMTLDLNGHSLEVSNVEVPIAALDGRSISITDNSESGGGTLELNTTSSDSAPTGITAVGTGSSVLLDDKVTADIASSADNGKGVSVYSGGSVAIKNATVSVPISGSSTGVYADGAGSSISIIGNINGGWTGVSTVSGAVTITGNVSTGYGGSGSGLRAIGGSISVSGDVSSTGGGNYGVYADNGATIVVTGDVKSGSVGAAAYANSQITINGLITYSVAYIEIGSYANYLSTNGYVLPTTKEGYLTYSDGNNTIWVNGDIPNWTDGITGTDQYPFDGGNGSSAEEAYEISTPEQLAQLSYNVNNGNDYSDKYFKLTGDIDLLGKLWTPIGYRFYPGAERGFNGNFDGTGYAITNLSIGTEEQPNTGGEQTQAGLFGAIKYDAILKDIGVEATIYTDSVTGVGALVGYSESGEVISGCYASGSIVSTGGGDLRIGGLIGNSEGASIINCSSDVDVTASGGTAIGGVLGYPGHYSASETKEINGCIFTGTINAGDVPSYGGVGGIAGKSDGYIVIVNSANKGTILGEDGNIGGIVGIQHNDVVNCYSSGPVTSSDASAWVGGITGYVDFGKVYNCYDSGIVTNTGSNLVGALVGYGNAGTTVSNGYFDGTVNPDLAHVRSTGGNKYYLHEFTTEEMKGADPGGNVDYAAGYYASGTGAFEAALNGWLNVQTTYPSIDFANWKTVSDLNSGYPYLVGVDYAAGTDSNLSALSASGITLSPVFSSDVTSYSANVANNVNTTTVTATPNDSGATVEINGTETTSQNVALNVGSNVITVEVTAEDGITTKTYTVTITRAAASGGGGSVSTGTQISVETSDGDTAVTGTLNSQGNKDQVTVLGTQFEQLENVNKEVVITMPRATVTFDPKAMDTINGASSTGSVLLTVETVNASILTPQQQERIGNRPVYDFTLMRGGTQISNFGGGHAEISIPYTLAPGENPNQVVIYYLADDGSLKPVRGHYDRATGSILFRTSHFSRYAVGYHAVSFTDVSSNAWYKDAIDFISARDITTGTSPDTFSPEATLTRGQFIVLLMNAYGISSDLTKADTVNFVDAGNTYYTKYLLAGKSLGIVSGIGNNQYAPEQAITRQEMFVMLYNALKALGEVPAATETKQLSDFSDTNQIAAWAQDALAALVQSGIISGTDGKLAPTETTSRAQMAQVLYNLLGK